MKRVWVETADRREPAFVDRIGDVLWVHYQGHIYSIPLTESKSKRARGGGEAETPDVLAPMPGKITQILCKKDDKVAKGQILIVMEAMKMEYNLKAAQDGVISSIEIKVLDQVQLGQLLVKVRV